jgi:hypothetical protein
MTQDRRIVVVGKLRDFDDERWKQLLTAMAYVLHERRKQFEAVRGGDGDERPEDGREGGGQ